MSDFIHDLIKFLGISKFLSHPLCGVAYFFDFLTTNHDDDTDSNKYFYTQFLQKFPISKKIKNWKLNKIRPLTINTFYLHQVYITFCYNFFFKHHQLYPTPYVFPDEDSFIDEVLSLSTTITYDYYTKRVTLPPFNVLVKDIKGE